jgi:integrase/recombinase XerD
MQRKEVLTEKEARKLKLNSKSLRDALIIGIFLYTGVRRCELVNIEISHIDLEKRRLHVAKGKNRKKRDIPYPRRLVSATKRYLEIGIDDTDSKYIFPSGEGSLTKGRVSTIVRNMGERAGIQSVMGEGMDGRVYYRVTPHLLRHTFATWAYNRGMNVHKIMEMMGHEDLDTTWGYIHTNRDDLQDEYEDNF